MRSVRVPSRATSLASAVADSSTSPAETPFHPAEASAGSAMRRASRSALPVLFGITSLPHIRLLLGESPGLQILFAGAQRVQQSLRLAAIHGFFGRRRARSRLRLVLALLRGGRILLLLWLALLLLSGGALLRRRRLLPFAGLIALLRLGLLLSALPRELVGLGLAGGIRPALILRAQKQLQVHLGVDIRRIERQGSAVLPDGLVRVPERLAREREIVRGLRFQGRIPVLKRPGGLAGGFRRLRWIELEQHAGAVEGYLGIVRHPRSGAIVLAQGGLRIISGCESVAARHVVILPPVQPLDGAADRSAHPREDARRPRRLRHHHDALGRGEEQREQERSHATALRRSGPSPRAAAAQSRANAGQANQGYLSSYWTERRDSNSPLWIFSSSGRNFRTPRSAPPPASKAPFPWAVNSRSPAMSVRVRTVRPSLSFL